MTFIKVIPIFTIIVMELKTGLEMSMSSTKTNFNHAKTWMLYVEKLNIKFLCNKPYKYNLIYSFQIIYSHCKYDKELKVKYKMINLTIISSRSSDYIATLSKKTSSKFHK